MSVRSSLYYRRGAGGKVAIEDMRASTGQRFFVCSGTGTDDSSHGFTPDKPFATLDYAIGKCTASKGDIIYLMPGHAESLTAANTCTLDVAGVQVIGIGIGALVPTFTLATNATATISVTAANCRIANIKVISDVADQAVGITASATADGLVIEDCLFTDGGLTKELVIAIQVAAACDAVLIRRNLFLTTVTDTTGGCASAIKFVGASAGSRVEDNVGCGHWTVAAIDAGTASNPTVPMIVRGNAFANTDTGAGLGYKGHASSINLLAYNNWAGSKNNTEPVTGVTASYCLSNFGADAAAAGSIASPANAAFS
jgi:hypothetical protein